MMTLRQFYLAKLAEECQEVAQRALKSMQFGEKEIQDGQKDSNRTRLTGEIYDLLSVVRLLHEKTKDIKLDFDIVEEHYRNKKNKIQKYLKLSQDLGMVERESKRRA